MPLNLISNFAANVAQRNLGMSDSSATSSLAKLSAGSRVLSAKDDAASLAVGSRLAAEVAGLKQAAVNAGQAVSMLQIADGETPRVPATIDDCINSPEVVGGANDWAYRDNYTLSTTVDREERFAEEIGGDRRLTRTC
mgnify:CR=1 FL=1